MQAICKDLNLHVNPPKYTQDSVLPQPQQLYQTVFVTGQRTTNGMLNQPSHQTFHMDKVMKAMRQQGVAAESFRNVEIVAPHLRSQILAGKDINLALLLMPSNESTSDHRRVDFE